MRSENWWLDVERQFTSDWQEHLRRCEEKILVAVKKGGEDFQLNMLDWAQALTSISHLN